MALLDERAVLPDDVPDVPFGVSEAEAGEAVLGVARLGDLLRTLDG